ncbi:hypothetical protein RND71_023606 [Anisodus tanguticus]|uniref:NTF2 domain-containing protein n=1 Tax=Anisodus tanguticus TaxID=243964 RepID=A0AAE1RVY3_9SOLA|nr:hypothetical protein RND71_023606 [Anisodus tanguticus]
MATQENQHSAEIIALSFVDKYYRILHRLIDQSHRFYKDDSVLSWPQHDGDIKSVTTSQSGERAKSPSDGFRNNEYYGRGSESRSRPQSSDGQRGEGYQHQNYRRDNKGGSTNYN